MVEKLWRRRKSMDFLSQSFLDSTPVFLLNNYVTLGKLFNFFKPVFSSVKQDSNW